MFYFGAKTRSGDGKKVKEEIKGSVTKPSNVLKKTRYLIYDSKDTDPTVRAKEEKVYRTFFVYPGTNRAIDDPSRHLIWFFYDNPEAPPNEYTPSVSNTDIGNSHYITLQRRSWKTPEGVKKNADVICVFYQGTNRTVLYQGSQGVGRPPYFYFEIYDPLTGKANKKLYGMIATSFTPPSSPQRSPGRSPGRSQFGKKRSVKKVKHSL